MYISTDSREVNSILGFQSHPNNNIEDLDIKFGEAVKTRIGFNPMSSFDLRDVQINEARKMAMRLLRRGLLVTICFDEGNCDRYFPKGLREREQLTKASLRKDKAFSQIRDYQMLAPNYAIICYSNDPSKIKTFVTNFF